MCRRGCEADPPRASSPSAASPPGGHPTATVVLFMTTIDSGPIRQPVEASFFNQACGGVGLIHFSHPHLAPTTPFASSSTTANPSAAMGLFGNSNDKGKGKGTPDASSSRAPLPPPPPAATHFRPGRRRLHIPVHQARWHWEYRQPLPYPDVTLPHRWHMDSQRILVPTVPRTQRAHDDEVRMRRAAHAGAASAARVHCRLPQLGGVVRPRTHAGRAEGHGGGGGVPSRPQGGPTARAGG
ncbi:hypothetical protein ACQJBY_009399 [Aegilops geniculata]